MAEGSYTSNDIQFVDDPLKDSNCPVCLELLKDPFLTECCGHHFCSNCINSVQRQQDVCPLCKTRPIIGIIDKRFKRELNESQIYCPLRSQGCEWIGKLGHLNTHLNEGEQFGQCKYVAVNCPNNCFMAFPRREIKKHANNECKYRPFTCPYCGHKGVFIFVEQHHYPKCPSYPVTCPNNCTKKIKRSQLQKHFGVCPNAIVACPYSDIGCKVKMKRCNLKKHGDSNVAQHQLLITTAISDLQRDNTTIKKNCQLNSQQISTQLESAQTRISSLEKKCSKLENEFYNITEEVKKQKKQFTEELEQTQSCLQILFNNYSEVQETLSLTCEENEQLKHSLDSLHSTHYTLESEVRELKNQLATANYLSAAKNAETKEVLCAFMKETKKMLKDEVTDKIAFLQHEVSVMSGRHLQVDYWIDGYQLMAERMKEANWELYLRTMAETATQFPDPICPVILHVSGYEEAKRYRNTLLTPSFYIKTAKGQYKFLLVINFTADNMVVSASLTRGKYDNSLPWPFTGTIVVTLLNPAEDKNHCNKEIWSTSDSPGFKYAGRPSDQLRNPSWSRDDFISFKELDGSSTSRCFVMNNSLYFEVNNSARRNTSSNNCCLS